MKQVTVPRLELNTATVAVRVNAMIQRELEIPVNKTVFWTDSTTVLRYINNESARFKTFVANHQVEVIHDGSHAYSFNFLIYFFFSVVNSKIFPKGVKFSPNRIMEL